MSNSCLNKTLGRKQLNGRNDFLGNPEDRAVAFESSWPLLCRIWKASSPVCISVLLCCLSKEKGVGCRPELDLTRIVFCTSDYNQMWFSSDGVFSLKMVRSLIIWPGYYSHRPLCSNLWFIHSWQHVSLEKFLFSVWNSFFKNLTLFIKWKTKRW